MFYVILIILLAVMAGSGIRANLLNLEVEEMAVKRMMNPSDTQEEIWYELGAFNRLLLAYGPNTPLSFLAGMAVILAYVGLWMCALGNWTGLWMVVIGLLVCALIQYTMVVSIKRFFKQYEETLGEDPKKYYTGKNGLPHAIYTSVMIGIGKAMKFLLICSVVGIMIYVIIKNAMLRSIDLETMAITGNYNFPPHTIYDQNDQEWVCAGVMGPEKNIKVYRPLKLEGSYHTIPEICVDVNKLLTEMGKENMSQNSFEIGNRTFHWES